MMRRLLLLLPLLLPGLTNQVRAQDLPVAAKFARYEPMVKRSPFAVATATVPTDTAPDFARELYIANAAHSADGDFVTLASTTDKSLKEYLSTRETVNGYSISNIQWSDRVGETKVTITKDGKFATLTFNEALLSQVIQNPIAPMVQPSMGNPGRPPGNGPQAVPGQIQRPMPVPQIPTPPPHVRPTIRRKVPPQRQPLNPSAGVGQSAVQEEADIDTP